MKKVLIFGATGNIGAYLTDYLFCNLDKNQYEVIAIGRKDTYFFSEKGIQYFSLDVTDPEGFKRLPCNNVYAIINLVALLPAYLSKYDPLAYVDVNIKGAINILEFARKVGVDRVLYTQTWSVQGGYWNSETVLSPGMPKKVLFTGDHAFYSITKGMIEDTMQYYKEEYGIKNFIFRLPNVYMYHPNKFYNVNYIKKVVGYRYMIDRAIKGEDIELWGNPDAYKDILYIKDLCQLMYKAVISNVFGGIYNAGTGIKTTLRQQIEGIIDVFSTNARVSKIIEMPDKSNYVSFVMDIKNAKEELGYMPEYSYLKYLEDYKVEMKIKKYDKLWNN